MDWKARSVILMKEHFEIYASMKRIPSHRMLGDLHMDPERQGNEIVRSEFRNSFMTDC